MLLVAKRVKHTEKSEQGACPVQGHDRAYRAILELIVIILIRLAVCITVLVPEVANVSIL